jgi:hypothetical protein
MFGIALIIALLLASLPVASVFAQDGGTGGDDSGNGEGVSANQVRELRQAWFNNFRTRPGQDRNSERISRYLDQYAFALSQANALLVGGGTNGQSNNASGQGDNANGQENGNNPGANQSWGSPKQLMAQYLGMMRNLRAKIAAGGNANNNNNNGNNGAGTSTGAGTTP